MGLGYQTVRSIRPVEAIPRSLKAFRPDVVVVTCGDPAFAVAALRATERSASLLYIRDAASAIAASAGAHFDVAITNSRFVREAVHRAGGQADFLPSLFPPALYDVPTTREKVLFVNPTPRKGVDIAIDLAAARPDIPFVFSRSWRIGASALRKLRRTARLLTNIEIRDATVEPRTLFRDCRLVIVPTQVPEAWCRVVSEAQIIGIPSLASRLGGLPESVGPGGILVEPPTSTSAWRNAVSEVWDDEDRYEQLSERALLHSRRPELSVDLAIRRFEDLVTAAIGRHARC
jgi:glycosyltransferase involved in cell wall biosynthesis